jgi:hypothetical protein
MIKNPQNIVKISSQASDGDYLQMVFEADGMDEDELTERFKNFMRGMGYAVDTTEPEIVQPKIVLPVFNGNIDEFIVPMLMTQYNNVAISKSKHPEDIEVEAILLDAIDTVLEHNLTSVEFSQWLEHGKG